MEPKILVAENQVDTMNEKALRALKNTQQEYTYSAETEDGEEISNLPRVTLAINAIVELTIGQKSRGIVSEFSDDGLPMVKFGDTVEEINYVEKDGMFSMPLKLAFYGPSTGWLSELVPQDWKKKIGRCLKTKSFKDMETWLGKRYDTGTVYPEKENIFNALRSTALEDVKVVIIGQDPYHGGQAHGLSFSVARGCPIPPSLRNIYKELTQEDFSVPTHGCLQKWAEAGVLMLNAALTVEAHKPNSHANAGWETVTNTIINVVNDLDFVVFLLWGNFAHGKENKISARHKILKAPHPSPLAKNYVGCGCFKAANDALVKAGKAPIDWCL